MKELQLYKLNNDSLKDILKERIMRNEEKMKNINKKYSFIFTNEYNFTKEEIMDLATEFKALLTKKEIEKKKQIKKEKTQLRRNIRNNVKEINNMAKNNDDSVDFKLQLNLIDYFVDNEELKRLQKIK